MFVLLSLTADLREGRSGTMEQILCFKKLVIFSIFLFVIPCLLSTTSLVVPVKSGDERARTLARFYRKNRRKRYGRWSRSRPRPPIRSTARDGKLGMPRWSMHEMFQQLLVVDTSADPNTSCEVSPDVRSDASPGLQSPGSDELPTAIPLGIPPRSFR